MKGSNRESPKLDRKTVERNRRIHMKGLCFKLSSLLPPHFKHSKDHMLSQQDQLDQAAAYIKHLKERLEKLKKKEQGLRSLGANTSSNYNEITEASINGLKFPVVELRDFDSNIDIVLISGLNKNFMLCQVITILEEEGAEVVAASFSTVGDKIFHSIHAQVRISRVGVETTRVCQRLQELVYLSCM